jgi:23S rRNA pseudouridine1911/1915/1917 synthase
VEKLFEIIHEDADLLVVNKPAGLVCHPTKTDEYSSLISRARIHLGPASHPQLVNRLDRETSGVILLGKNDDSARELRRLWENRSVRKNYLAIVHGHMPDDHGCVDAPIGRDEGSRVAIKDCVRADGSPAQTEFRVEKWFERDPPAVLLSTAKSGSEHGRFTLLSVQPLTGRKHQIRIHLAHLGHPVVGDKLYGGDEDLYLALVEGRLNAAQRQRLLLPHHALHARAVRFMWRNREWQFSCEPEEWFREFIPA